MYGVMTMVDSSLFGDEANKYPWWMSYSWKNGVIFKSARICIYLSHKNNKRKTNRDSDHILSSFKMNFHVGQGMTGYFGFMTTFTNLQIKKEKDITLV